MRADTRSRRPERSAGQGSPRAGQGAPVAPARACAHSVLLRCCEQGAYADRAFHSAAERLGARDRALAMRLAYGALQHLITLDHLLAAICTRELDRLDPGVRAALRLGLYELLYLEGAPARAITNDAVTLAAASVHGVRGRRAAAAGFVNAVLRRAAGEGRALLERLDDQSAAGAALAHSVPSWLARMWFSLLGDEGARALLAACNEPAEVALRVNTLRAQRPEAIAALGAKVRSGPWPAEALVLQEPCDLQRSAAFRAGLVVAQSRAAMLAADLLDLAPGQRVLDLCAAPGGKATHIAARLGGRGEVVALEQNSARAAALSATVARLGAGAIAVRCCDALAGVHDAEGFDRVLVDPPCSGLGTLQRHPDLLLRAGPRRIQELSALQRALLLAGADALRPGGLLLYATCTISPGENEAVVAGALAERADLELLDLAACGYEQLRAAHAYKQPPRAGVVAAIAQRALLTLPSRDRTAGFFYAALRRHERRG
ncbi:MAG TPA: transcription antitermination factor NusB [Solirubrobacteraceae bacterium]|nr:transcription antitermination factor NusB [Solirubrobacteraceae bacterium]